MWCVLGLPVPIRAGDGLKESVVKVHGSPENPAPWFNSLAQRGSVRTVPTCRVRSWALVTQSLIHASGENEVRHADAYTYSTDAEGSTRAQGRVHG